MERKEILKFEKSGMNSKGAWAWILCGGLTIFGGDFYTIIGIVGLAWGIYKLTRKSKAVVYNDGFVISSGNNINNINFDRLLGIKGELDQKVKLLYLKKDFSEYSQEEMKNIGGNFNSMVDMIILDDNILERDFLRVFNSIKNQFVNYVFNKYNDDVEEVLKSVYLFEQIVEDKLSFSKGKLFGGTTDIVIDLIQNDAVNVTVKKKAYMTTGRQDLTQSSMSFEPVWKFSSASTKCDTVNLINADIIKKVLIRKYNMKFI